MNPSAKYQTVPELALTLNEAVLAAVSTGLLTACRASEPAASMLQPLNVATPFAAVVLRPPAQMSVPVPTRLKVTTVVLSDVTVALKLSCTATDGWVANATPVWPLAGCCRKTSFAAAPVTLNAELSAVVRTGLEVAWSA